jgi:cellulose synthase/poly-beta-1,6-N-acetylglucosamine synthase-like glycosyltransferase
MAVPDNTRYLGPRGFDQANFTLSADQRNVIILLVLGVIILFIQAGTGPALLIINSIFTIFFLVSTTYRLSLIDMSLRSRGEIKIDGKLEPPHGEWPEYVIQVDDEATKGAVETANIELPFVVIDIPVSYPRTKPKACNVGLAVAKGDYLVIYDAEDRPDPDQLKKAVIGFSQCEREVACIQAKLNFYNTERNLLTRCFSAEYAMWFDLCLPGLDALRAPIPLGGTGWDEYNVTEDCDLGLRLFSQGWQTRILDSTTWEEACPKLTWWIKQRSRWVKGYMQTYLVHTRDILGLTKKLGIVNSMHFHLLIGGSVLAQLLSTIYWILVCVWLGWRPDIIGTFFPGPIFAMAALCLFVGNFAFVYTCAIACECRVGLGKVVKYTPLMVIYWIIMSVAGWKGALQLIWKPHFWEKTQHHAD